MSELKKHDRVIVSMRRRRTFRDPENFWRGEIVGESRCGNCWIVKRDNYQSREAYHKDFCSKEPSEDASGAKG